MKKLLVAGLLIAAGPAMAADLGVPTKAPAVSAAPIPDWSGAYIGGEGGYAWGKQSFDQPSFAGFGGAGNINNILNAPDSSVHVLFPEFKDPGIGASINQSGALGGLFAGYQRQLRGSGWVVGGEVDADWASITGSSSASLVSKGEQVSSFRFASPSISGSASVAPETITIPGQTITSTGATSPQTITIPGPTITVSGQTITLPDQTITVGPLPVIGQESDTVAGPCIIPDPLGGCILGGGTTTTGPDPVTGTTGAQTITIPGQTVVVNGQTIVLPAVKIVIPGQTVTSTGTTAPQTVTIPGQTAPVTGVVNASVLERAVSVTDVTRTANIDTKIDFLASARGKLGYAFTPSFMLYGTAGAGFAHATTTITETETFALAVGESTKNFSASASISGGSTLVGWVAGAGLDYKFFDNGADALIVGGEYLHYDFPKNTIGLTDGSASVNFNNSHQTVDKVVGRLSWLIH